MKILVNYLRHDKCKTTLQVLTTIIDEIIVGPAFAQVSTDLQPLTLFYWLCLRLRKFLSLKRKAKLTWHFGESEKKFNIWLLDYSFSYLLDALKSCNDSSFI